MSSIYVGAAFKSPYRDSTLLALITMADSANDHGIFWYGVQTLADKCKLSPRAFRDRVAVLRRDGRLLCQSRPGRSNVWRLMLPADWFAKPHADEREIPPELREVREAAPSENTPTPAGSRRVPLREAAGTPAGSRRGVLREAAPRSVIDPSDDPSGDPSSRVRAKMPVAPKQKRDPEPEPEPERQPIAAPAFRTIPAASAPIPRSAAPLPPPPAPSATPPTTIGASEDRATWERIVAAIAASDGIKLSFMRPARLFRFPDDSWLLMAHSTTGEMMLDRYRDTLAMLLGKELRRRVRLVIRARDAVRAQEERLV